MGGSKCPICNTLICELRLDKEFDMINNPTKNTKNFVERDVINVDFGDKLAPGITLINNIGPGVKIKKINDEKKCYKSGLRENDIILFINEVPCTNHIDTIKIIENTYKTGRVLRVELLKIN